MWNREIKSAPNSFDTQSLNMPPNQITHPSQFTTIVSHQATSFLTFVFLGFFYPQQTLLFQNWDSVYLFDNFLWNPKLLRIQAPWSLRIGCL